MTTSSSHRGLFRRLLGPCACAPWLLAGFGVQPDAAAETPSPLAEWQYAAGSALRPFESESLPDWETTLGVSTEWVPRYEGSTRDRLLAAPMIDVRYQDLAFASTSEGLGINVLHSKTRRAGVALTYDFGREHGASAETQALDDIHAAPEAKLFAEYILFPLVLRADLRRNLGGYGGLAGDLSAYTPVASSKHFLALIGPAIGFADRHYMQRYFGITPGESVRSGYPARQASGGIKSINLGADAIWFIDDRWFINGTAAAEWLLNDAARSPLTRQKLQRSVLVTLGYPF